MERRLFSSVRITGVPEVVGEIVAHRTPKLVGTRLGEDFDASITQPVVLRGEWIRIDPNFPDGIFGRQVASTESVDKNGTAVRPRGRPGESLKIRRQIVGIIGERVQVRSPQNDCARISGSLRAYGGTATLLDRHLLLLRYNVQE